MTTENLWWACVAVFVPLFPLSMIFNAAYAAVRWTWVRLVMLLLWPQIGLWLVPAASAAPAHRLAPWLSLLGLATGVFYAWRLLSVRALNVWVAFWATSAWSLAWGVMLAGGHGADLRIAMAGVSVTAAALACGVRALADCWGEAYLGPRHGLGRQAPRLAGVLVVGLLAAMGTPVLPMFFVMLWLVMHTDGYGVVGAMVVWLLWSWSAARVWQVLLFGAERKEAIWSQEAVTDLSRFSTMSALLLAIAGAGAAMIWSARWLMQ
ncbi:MAG: hypothetical protein QJR02_07875 [Sinobacteraceae bacterium]|nr:hypothetical protein [Nevskiaceae bacterium]